MAVFDNMEMVLWRHVVEIDNELRDCEDPKVRARLLLAKSNALQASVQFQIHEEEQE